MCTRSARVNVSPIMNMTRANKGTIAPSGAANCRSAMKATVESSTAHSGKRALNLFTDASRFRQVPGRGLPGNRGGGPRMFQALDEVSRQEVSAGNGMLSALVVRKYHMEVGWDILDPVSLIWLAG